MNDEMIDDMIDQAIREDGRSSDASAPLFQTDEGALIRELAQLRDIDWIDEAIEDRLVQALITQSTFEGDGPVPTRVALAPGHRGRDLRWRRRAVTVVSVAALVAALAAVPLLRGHSSPTPDATQHGHLQMTLVDSVSSPFQAVGADPGAFYLQCVTDSTCYGSSGSYKAPASAVIDRTDDGGASWQATAPLPAGLSMPLACTSATDCMAAVTQTPGPGAALPNALPIATTNDGGSDWTASSLVLPPALAGAQILDVACATDTQCVVFVGVQNFPQGTTQPDVGTFFTTADGGLTWTESAPVPAVANDSVVTMTCASNGNCIAVTYAGSAGTSGPIDTVLSTDFGRTWMTEPSAPLLLDGGELLISCGDTLHCMMVGSGSSNNVVIASTANGGQTWKVSAAPAGWDTGALSISCATGSDCYISTADGSKTGFTNPVIEATSDAGATWTTLNLPTVNGAELGMVQPLSCPNADGCIGVGALSGQPSSVLVSSLPSAL